MGMAVYTGIRRSWELFTAQWVFCITSARRRKRFVLRFALSLAVLLCVSAFGDGILGATKELLGNATNWHVNSFLNGGNMLNMVYYLALDALSVAAIAVCFDMRTDELLFRSLAGHATDMIKGAAFSFIDAATIGTSGSGVTSVAMIVVYGILRFIGVLVFNVAIFLIIGRKWRAGDNVSIGKRSTSIICYTAMILIIFVTNIIASMLLYGIDGEIRYSGMILLMLMCVSMVALQTFIYSTYKRRLEAEVISQLLRERETQYAMSKENIELINRKCHDLKHQVRALRLASKEERNASLDELERSVMIYDSVIKTGNAVLDTVLSEKMLYCQNHDIRMTAFSPNKELPDIINAVDMYVMLGNATDNAIEAAEKISDKRKRIIDITVTVSGAILCFSISNYCEEKLEFSNGLPVTSKEDKTNHGFGIGSIKAVAEKYNGTVRITLDEGIFTLLIGIPVP